jgi:hypothetical protein
LSVIEVRGDRDDGPGDGLAQVRFGGFLEAPQDHRRDFRRRVALVLDPYADVAVVGGLDVIGHHFHFALHLGELPPHESLDRIDGVRRIGDRLPLGHLTHQPFPCP